MPAAVADQFIAQADGGKSLIQFFSAPEVVEHVCSGWLGMFGGLLALLGVVAAPITSGDTAFRSARLIVAEALGIDQRAIRHRLYVCIPMFIAAVLLLVWQMENPDGFNVIWQYFGWANQTLSVFTLWALTVYLVEQKKRYVMTLIPALFMTTVCSTFIFVSNQAFGLQGWVGYGLGLAVFAVAIIWFVRWKKHAAV